MANYCYEGDDKFYKSPVFYQDSVKSIPCLLYERYSHAAFSRRGGITFLNGRPAFNTINPEYYIREYDIERPGQEQIKVALSTLYTLSEEEIFNRYIKDRFIVIGNFAGDVHETYLVEMPGALIVFNIFLTLQEHPNTISLWWLAMLLVIYILLSYEIFYRERPLIENEDRKYRNHIVGWIAARLL